VRAYDADQAGDTPFLVMEFVAGTDLARLVRQRGPLPVAEACEYVRQAAAGLHHAHEHRLVHRDVKPSNLLVTHGSAQAVCVKVLDLGLALLREGGGPALSHVVGTPDYLAPEQWVNTDSVDARADVYSLGGTLYYLLTGQPPSGGRTRPDEPQA